MASTSLRSISRLGSRGLAQELYLCFFATWLHRAAASRRPCMFSGEYHTHCDTWQNRHVLEYHTHCDTWQNRQVLKAKNETWRNRRLMHDFLRGMFFTNRMAKSLAASWVVLDPMAHSSLARDSVEQRLELAAKPNVGATDSADNPGNNLGDILAASSHVAARHEVAAQLDPSRQKCVQLLAFGKEPRSQHHLPYEPWSLDWFSFAWALELYHRWYLR